MDSWLTPQALALIVGVLGLGGGGGILFNKQLKKDKEVDITKKIKDLAAETIDELSSEVNSLRSYMYEDSNWHDSVIAILRDQGIPVPKPPRFPDRILRRTNDPEN